MKKIENIQSSVSYLEEIFKALNTKYFDGVLPVPNITVSSIPEAYGHFIPLDNGTVEINIGSGTFDRHIENVAAILLHTMIRYYCYIQNIKDNSRGGQYLNKRFKAEAESRGLIVKYSKKTGFSITHPSEELIDFVLACGFEDIKISRGSKKGNSIKWVCPCCGDIVRSTKNVNIICGNCGEKFKRDDKDKLNEDDDE